MERAWQIFDADGKGFVNHSSLKAIVKKWGQACSDDDIAEMIRLFDRDQDGRISKQDFARILKYTILMPTVKTIVMRIGCECASTSVQNCLCV